MRILFFTVSACTLVAAIYPAAAQYKYIEPNGKGVTYSDVPPPANAKLLKEGGLPAIGVIPANPGGRNSTPMPYELQQLVQSFPVILYTMPNCASCDDGRNYLRNRGIPFSEKTVKTNDDMAALKRVSPAATLPAVVVGTTKAIGFSPASWGDLLDTAGYPSTSRLSAGYQYAPVESAAPQAEPAKTGDEGAGQEAANRQPASTPQPAPAGNAPPGFKF